ncbi:MAG: hypothetical protein Dasosvirus12_1 [Dasosvirus sp.]|uniref:Uncharacterized protein n=1 Tax=Dasosvirus sp. TaxID=2487764 RepID=A0A3G4ZVZ1_9VIRU|nr:MAG: hypothetical protein Dasosvirus12_1 [Dasosvirus sp.]
MELSVPKLMFQVVSDLIDLEKKRTMMLLRSKYQSLGDLEKVYQDRRVLELKNRQFVSFDLENFEIQYNIAKIEFKYFYLPAYVFSYYDSNDQEIYMMINGSTGACFRNDNKINFDVE